MRLRIVGPATDPELSTTPMVLETIGPQQIVAGAVFNIALAPLFFNRDGDELSFSVLGLPDGLSVYSGTGRISGVLQTGTFMLTLRA